MHILGVQAWDFLAVQPRGVSSMGLSSVRGTVRGLQRARSGGSSSSIIADTGR